MQSEPVLPPYEPPLALSINDSSRRILWIIGLYRALCAAVLLGIALLLDLRILRITSFRVTAAGGSVYWMVIVAIPFLLPLMLQVGFGMSPFQSGLITFSSAIGAMTMKRVPSSRHMI